MNIIVSPDSNDEFVSMRIDGKEGVIARIKVYIIGGHVVVESDGRFWNNCRFVIREEG